MPKHFRKLLLKFGKRPSVEETGSGSVGSKSDRHGLFLVAGECAPRPTDREYFPVDIIALHGLNGNAITTWTHENGTFWLRDLLPQSMPGCRVFSFGYPSEFAFSDSFATVQDYSRRLLSSIRDVRENENQESRPIIFVCHSLGGIVLKQALVFAHEDDVLYGNVLRSVVGAVFLATPHNGSDTASLGSIVGKILNIGFATTTAGTQPKAIRTDLLDYLSSDSTNLQDLAISVRNRLHNLTIVSFYESERQLPLSSLIVDKRSSILGIPREDVSPLWSNHRDICRFSGETDSYKAVSAALRRIARNTLSKQSLKRRSTHSSQLTLDDSEKTCMTQFSIFDLADYLVVLPKPVNGTCQWILVHPKFTSWLGKTENALLWLTGHPGCGKTVLSFFLLNHLEQTRTSQTPTSVCAFFCDDKISKQKDAKDILKGLIFQVISRHRSLIRHAKRVFETHGQNMFQSFTALWNLLIKAVTDSKSGTTYIIIDALDECEKSTRDNLLDSIRTFTMQSPTVPVGSVQQHVKFILTGRPYLLELGKSIGDVTEYRIPIDEGEKGHDDDIRIFIRERLDEISMRRNCSQETKEFLQKTLYSEVGQTFLWVHMVFGALESSLLASKKDFQEIISRIPPDLKLTYMRFLSDIPPSYQSTAVKLLKLILGSTRPLNMHEINIAFTINDSHHTLAELESSWQPAILRTIQGTLGPISPIESILSEPGSESPGSAVSIRYMGFSDDGDGAYNLSGAERLFQDPAILDEEVARTIAEIHPFYQYASRHWAEHFAICESAASRELRNMAKKLLDINLANSSNWLRFLAAEASARGDDAGSIPTDSPGPVTLGAYFDLHATVKDFLGGIQPVPMEDKDSALFWASWKGHAKTVEVLLNSGAQLQTRVLEKQSAIIVAAENGYLDCVSELLAHTGADVNIQGRSGRTALSFACGGGHHDVVKKILSQEDSLSWAAKDGMEGAVKALLSGPDIDPNLQDRKGRSPLSWAAGNGCTGVVRILIRNRKVDKGSIDRDKRNAVSWASTGGHVDTLQMLLKYGCPGVDDQDVDGWTPLAWATQSNSPETMEALIASGGVDLEQRDHGGRTALSWAVEYGHIEVVRTLLREGADPSTESNEGLTPIMAAEKFKRKDILDELMHYVNERARRADRPL
ncbi:hypothetical protein B0H63DRAFT_507002 [Podospora didyma]|uniref:Uncharacterized protein n=1 Tax=Podospora didyma TaxID=330526 RepID=A0AAE0U3E1_9PEZI|nr:hypothetical protein B0H63DRAFT_507002 [Podospora didyma]